MLAIMYYAPALRLFLKQPHAVGETPCGRGREQEITPEEEGDRVAPAATDYSARGPLSHLNRGPLRTCDQTPQLCE